MSDLELGPDGRRRCSWCAGDAVYRAYHDEEWGRFTADDRRLFEFIVLESAQAGLSWITILKKRAAYREAYDNFNPERIAAWGAGDVERLMGNPLIVRNKKKIEASVDNARAFLEIAGEYGGFGQWLLGFFDGKPLVNRPKSPEDVPVTSDLAQRAAKAMKKRGFRFFGPVIAYSYLQAVGFINDHLTGCWVSQESPEAAFSGS